MNLKYFTTKNLDCLNKIELLSNQIHIWVVFWKDIELFIESQLSCLNEKEVKKSKAYHNSDDRWRYLCGKILCKLLIAEYLGLDKKSIDFSIDCYGKPHFCNDESENIFFNISHSDDIVLLAFSRDNELGVDIEKIRKIDDYNELANNFFSCEEQQHIRKNNSIDVFYEIWSQKEAYLKAKGIGILNGLNYFSVINGVITDNQNKDYKYRMEILDINGYSASIAIKESECMSDKYIKDMTQYEGIEHWEQTTLHGHLLAWAEKYADKTALIDKDETISYKTLNEEVIYLATALLQKGISKGDKVLVQLPNKICFAKVLFSLSKIGAIPIMMLPAHRENELEGIIKVARPTAYIVSEKYLGYNYLPLANRLKEKFDCLKMVIVDGTDGGDCLLHTLRANDDSINFPNIDPYSTVLFLLSGGTTGIPKLIPRTHTDYMFNAQTCAKRCELDNNTVFLSSLPIAHNFPLSCPGLLGTLSVGGKVALSYTTSPDDILQMITEHRVTITGLVPAMINICMEMMEFDEDFDLSSLKVLQVGGAMLEESLAKKVISEWPCKLMQVFGTAEGLISTTFLSDSDAIIVNCQGKPISSADEVKIVDENDVEVGAEIYGELLSRGPYTIDGYYLANEVNKVSFTKDGYYRTGDRAMWTKEGNLRMGGRLKEQINRAGEKITPSEIEALLSEHSEIKESAVVGVADNELGHRICAFIMTHDDVELSKTEIHQFLKSKGIANYKMPDQVICVDIWPLTSVGKIDKKVLELLADEE